MSTIKGKISRVIGPVIDVNFDNGSELPAIMDALEVVKEDGTKVVLEVQQHIGNDSVRSIAMDSSDGFTRGMEVVATGAPILMPKGDAVKGRLFNVTGDAIDGIGEVSKENGLPIHREAPKFEDLSTATEVLFTGIKVIDLVEPYAKGGKIGLFGGAGVGKNSIDSRIN
jgi:F-type H+-transporting ATPase subunit beta